ncbi:Putative glycosyltransferase EpsE [Polaromonas vacuolata]|uniref:Glycosyltransferase EpsE n=1 Tax=Polaromonas vacuolata TaxID=37448 RepID=A0A6H2H7N6_9BURK|nr:glycosyltransferase [Polaromonas vacuolata]QJC55777.1 Putative glycosyltransferase EpsE [Polaromonas vacuolata]
MNINISVAMATFNGEKYLREQLDSILNQTFLPYEMVICDDGSTDGTIDIVKEFSRSAPFPVFLYLNENNLGYADNFLKCAALCKGDWIAFSDQDDIWLSNKFQKICCVIESHPDDELVLIGHTSKMADGNLELTKQKIPNFKKDAYIKRGSNFGFYCIVGFSMVFRSNLITNIDTDLRPRLTSNSRKPPGHDQWIGMLANAVGDIAYISEPLAIWRRHDLSLTNPPPAHQTFADAAKISVSALNPDPYILLADMAKESAESFAKISLKSTSHKIQKRAFAASTNFAKLSRNFRLRAELYKISKKNKKIKILAQMLQLNAYGGQKFYALGWKSFAKDVLVVFGIISR